MEESLDFIKLKKLNIKIICGYDHKIHTSEIVPILSKTRQGRRDRLAEDAAR